MKQVWLLGACNINTHVLACKFMMCSPSAVLGFSHTIKHCVTEAIAGANLFIFGVFAAAIGVR